MAKIVTGNINRICKEKNIDFTLSPSYLLDDLPTQINKIADAYIYFLYNYSNEANLDFQHYVKEIEMFLFKYDAKEKASIIYEAIGDIYIKSKKYNKSCRYYVSALDYNNKTLDDLRIVQLLQKLGTACIYSGSYKEAISFNNLALLYRVNIKDDLRYKLLFNTMLAHIYLEQFDIALSEISTIEKIFNNLSSQRLFSLNLEKANCYRFKKFYSEALNVNNNILSSLNNNEYENRLIVLGNILDIYIHLKDIKNMKIYIDKILFEIKDLTLEEGSHFLPTLYHQIGYAYNLIGNLPSAKKYFKMSFSLCKINGDLHMLENCMEAYMKILLSHSSLEEVNNFKSEVLDLISLDILPKNHPIIFNFIAFYNEKYGKDIIKNLLDFVLEI